MRQLCLIALALFALLFAGTAQSQNKDTKKAEPGLEIVDEKGKVIAPKQDWGAVYVTYDRTESEVRVYATPNLEVQVQEDLECKARLFSDGTEVCVRGRDVTVVRKDIIFTDLKKYVEVQVKEKTVTVTMYRGVRLKMLHK